MYQLLLVTLIRLLLTRLPISAPALTTGQALALEHREVYTQVDMALAELQDQVQVAQESQSYLLAVSPSIPQGQGNLSVPRGVSQHIHLPAAAPSL